MRNGYAPIGGIFGVQQRFAKGYPIIGGVVHCISFLSEHRQIVILFIEKKYQTNQCKQIIKLYELFYNLSINFIFLIINLFITHFSQLSLNHTTH
jgi:hypothetical protein